MKNIKIGKPTKKTIVPSLLILLQTCIICVWFGYMYYCFRDKITGEAPEVMKSILRCMISAYACSPLIMVLTCYVGYCRRELVNE